MIQLQDNYRVFTLYKYKYQNSLLMTHDHFITLITKQDLTDCSLILEEQRITVLTGGPAGQGRGKEGKKREKKNT